MGPPKFVRRDSRKLPVEPALSLGGGQFAAGQSHGFKDLFVLEGGLFVRALPGRRRFGGRFFAFGVAQFTHWNAAWLSLTAQPLLFVPVCGLVHPESSLSALK